MTVKAGDVITDALEEILVQADEAPIEASEGRAALRLLNDMMFSYDARGIKLGYTWLNSTGDVLTVPLGAIRWIKLQLAVELAPKYDAVVSVETLQKVRDAFRAVLNLVVEMGDSEYPYTLPQGSGNTYPAWTDDTFYPDQQATIITETGGSIALEEDTED